MKPPLSDKVWDADIAHGPCCTQECNIATLLAAELSKTSFKGIQMNRGGVMFGILGLSLLLACSGNSNAERVNTGVEQPKEKGATSGLPTVAEVPPVAGVPTATLQRGKQIYDSYCKTCHQSQGQGIPGVYPPLAKSDYLQDKQKVIRALVFGLSGPITVNGKKYNGVMPPAPYNDEDIAAVLTYVYNSFGNSGGVITAAEVAAVRKAGK